MTFCDAHFHLVQCGRLPDMSLIPDCTKYYACTCAHAPEEFEQQQTMAVQHDPQTARDDSQGTQHDSQYENNTPCRIVQSFGIHPQNPDESFIPFLEELLENKRIGAIGEAGFDFFTSEYASRSTEQENAWHAQILLASQYQIPLIVHCRKAQEKVFRDANLLCRIPAVVFHSFMGSPADALSLLRHRINGYFCFGKPLLNGKKSALSCVAQLPADCILLETDAPFQMLKGEQTTCPEEIIRVYEKVSEIKKINVASLCDQIEKNFLSVFN
jgi:TatD DNase family protein